MIINYDHGQEFHEWDNKEAVNSLRDYNDNIITVEDLKYREIRLDENGNIEVVLNKFSPRVILDIQEENKIAISLEQGYLQGKITAEALKFLEERIRPMQEIINKLNKILEIGDKFVVDSDLFIKISNISNTVFKIVEEEGVSIHEALNIVYDKLEGFEEVFIKQEIERITNSLTRR